tara:strand:+ start:165 stop:494 length:330 start_codon:yes stop_codon:yes gene_type:complete
MKKNKKGVIYSTNPNFQYEYDNEEQEKIANNKQLLTLHIDKHRAGKTVIIIKGFIGSNKDLKNLAKIIKKECSVGGSVKNNDIIIQGNVREKIASILQKKGIPYKKSGG